MKNCWICGAKETDYNPFTTVIFDETVRPVCDNGECDETALEHGYETPYDTPCLEPAWFEYR